MIRRHGRAPTPPHRLETANTHPDGPLAADPGLAALLFNYGRYLLISSSRTGAPGSREGSAWHGTPANLQGIWNDQLQAPWSSNFTTNINLQMNYWGAEPTGLAECAGPLFALIGALQETGAATAREYYGARGWAVHHNSDIWGYSKPVGHGAHSPEWSFWPMAGLWLVRHLWEHLQFGADDTESAGSFARDTAWPAIRGAAEFALDLLVEFPDGTLGTSPSTSPENSFTAPLPGGGTSRAAAAESVHHGPDPDPRRVPDAGLPRRRAGTGRRTRWWPRPRRPFPGSRSQQLAGTAGSASGWPTRRSGSRTHRHVSHLYLAYPGDAPLTPELEAAVERQPGRPRRRIHRLVPDLENPAPGPPPPAREGQRPPPAVLPGHGHRPGGQSGGLYPNLFGAHPPFQIDGNLGFVAGLAECLLQSHRTSGGVPEIELLPALPPELPDGAAHRLRARPGVEVDLEWKDGRLAGATLTLAEGHGSRAHPLRRTPSRQLHLEPLQATVLNLASFSPAGRPHDIGSPKVPGAFPPDQT